MDTRQLERARGVDLLALVGRDTQLNRIAGTHGGEWAGPCPFCGGVDRFHVNPHKPPWGKWYCRQCAPQGGDAIDYVQRRARLSFQEAVSFLAGQTALAPLQTAGQSRPAPVERCGWQTPGWQHKAQCLVAAAHATLTAGSPGAAGRAYLTQRGIAAETWDAWELGFAAVWHPVRRALSGAIILPWRSGNGVLTAVQYRFIGSEISRGERFGQLPGGSRTVYGLQLRQGRATLIVTEGELNAVSIWQVAYAWADVLSCGCQDNLRRPPIVELLQNLALPYRQVIVWADEREYALEAVDRIAPCNGVALWSERGDANDHLRRGTLAQVLDSCQHTR
jgi:hypothetical protein